MRSQYQEQHGGSEANGSWPELAWPVIVGCSNIQPTVSSDWGQAASGELSLGGGLGREIGLMKP